MRLGDLDALKEALTSETRDKFVFVCLSRVLEKIDNAPTVNIDWEKSDAYLDCIKRIKSLEKENDELRQFLRANFERPQGEWIKDYIGQVNSFCSKCDYAVGKKTKFCPNCGADMRKGGKK